VGIYSNTVTAFRRVVTKIIPVLIKYQVMKTYCLLIDAQLHSPLALALHGPRDWLQASAALLLARRGSGVHVAKT
jgi:hypothetical protein